MVLSSAYWFGVVMHLLATCTYPGSQTTSSLIIAVAQEKYARTYV